MATLVIQEVLPVLIQNRKDLLNQWEVEVVRECGALARVLDVEENGSVFSDILDRALEALTEEDDKGVQAGGRLKEALQNLSRLMTQNNVSPSETAKAIFLLRPTVFTILRREFPAGPAVEVMTALNLFIDRLGLITLDAYEESREALIHDQQRVMEDVAVPVVKVWDKILMIPLVGMLDSRRTQQMMEALLSAIETSQSRVAILDISGIPIVDTLVARHLIMTASSTRLMGAECIITGISAKISKTIIELGVDLTGILTRSSLADGLKLAFTIAETK